MSDSPQKLADLIAALPPAPTVLDVSRFLADLKSADLSRTKLEPVKLALVSSFTSDMLIDSLVAHGYCDGFDISVYNAPFGQYMQETLDSSSGLYRFAPDVVFFAVRLQDACPDIYYSFNSLDGPSLQKLTARWQTDWLSALRTFRSNSSALILCANYEQPAYPSLGLADADAQPSQCVTVVNLNAWLRSLAQEITDFHIVDIDALASRHGRARFTQPRMWFLARSAIAPDATWDYVGQIICLLRAVRGRSRKVLALDCDNTLWGGVLGELSSSGIALGHDFPGSAYVAFQRRILELYHRGIVLIVASRNDHSAVMDVFNNHPEMLLRSEHIAYFGINWDPKPQNLQRAAVALNLGLDSFVFIDDNPVECAMVRSILPEVLSICLPEDPAEFETALAGLDCFDQISVSAEDRHRGPMYRQEASRSELKTSVKDLETFYRELAMIATISRNDSSVASRAAQLTQRTNQFNMTTVRRTESQIKEFMSNPGYDVFTLRLQDRFGDNGIVGLAVVEHRDKEDILETFLMSCRVLGRTVETAFLSWLMNRSLSGQASRFTALYCRTVKNAPFADFYKSCRLQLADDDQSQDTQKWSYDLSLGSAEFCVPPWIEIRLASPAV
ncbi:MAG: HAD-IIIC family phosphatase [Actinobacteria bacterium]|nr:HAD-IIIC family phosphatase [Actinomycetota bacterium]